MGKGKGGGDTEWRESVGSMHRYGLVLYLLGGGGGLRMLIGWNMRHQATGHHSMRRLRFELWVLVSGLKYKGDRSILYCNK